MISDMSAELRCMHCPRVDRDGKHPVEWPRGRDCDWYVCFSALHIKFGFGSGDATLS